MTPICPSCGYVFDHDAPEGQLYRCTQCREFFRVAEGAEVRHALAKDQVSKTVLESELASRDVAPERANPDNIEQGREETADAPIVPENSNCKRVDQSCKDALSRWPVATVILYSLGILLAISLLVIFSLKGKRVNDNMVFGKEGHSPIKDSDTVKQFSQSVFSFQYPGDWIEFAEQERKKFVREYESQSIELFKAYHGSSAEYDALVPYAFGLTSPDESVTCIGVLMRIPPQASDYIDMVYNRSSKVIEWGKQQRKVKEVISNEKTKIGEIPIVKSELIWADGEHHIIITYFFPEATSYGGTLLIVMKPSTNESEKKDVSNVISSLKLTPPRKEQGKGLVVSENASRIEESWNTATSVKEERLFSRPQDATNVLVKMSGDQTAGAFLIRFPNFLRLIVSGHPPIDFPGSIAFDAAGAYNLARPAGQREDVRFTGNLETEKGRWLAWGPKKETSEYLTLDFSGKHVAFAVYENKKWHMVVDFRDEPPYDFVTPPVLSTNGERCAYAARRGGKWYVVVDGRESPPHDSRANIVFSPDSKRVAYEVRKGDKRLVVTDGHEEALYDYVVRDSLMFSPNSKRTAYIAKKGDKWFVVSEGMEGPKYDGIGGIVFSTDSKHLAYAAKEGDGCFVVLDGQEGQRYDATSIPVLSPRDGHLAYWTQRGDKRIVVVNGIEQESYDGVGFPVFSLGVCPSNS